MMHFLAGGRGGGRRGSRRRRCLRRFRSENEPPGALVLLLVRPANLRRPRGNSAEGIALRRGSGPRRTAAVRLATCDGKVDGEVRAHALAIALRAALPCPHRRFSAPRCRTTEALRAKMRLGRSFRAAERSTPAASRGRRGRRGRRRERKQQVGAVASARHRKWAVVTTVTTRNAWP